jgi:flagellar biosynthesis chaperone FliJ
LAKRSDNREQKVQLKKDQNMMDEFAMRVSRVRHT